MIFQAIKNLGNLCISLYLQIMVKINICEKYITDLFYDDIDSSYVLQFH